MEEMRELLRTNLRRTLQAVPETDRLAAAWPVVCGGVMAAHGQVTGYDGGVVWIEVDDGNWMGQMLSMRGQIGADLGRVAGVAVTGVHFERKRRPGSRG